MPVAPDTALRFLSGIGPARAATLAAHGLETAWDVLHAVPRCLGEPPPLVESGVIPRGAAVRVRARLLNARPSFARGRGRGMGLDATFVRADGTPLRARFFNAGYLRKHFLANEWYLLEGRADEVAANTLLHPAFVHLAGGETSPLPAEPGCRVAYHLPEGFAERGFQALVEACFAALPLMTDPAGELPDADYQAVLAHLHRPTTAEAHERARRVLAARELLALALRLQERRRTLVAVPGQAWAFSDDVQRRALARLPFALTPGQAAALHEIRADLRAAQPMYRLLQGDVGSGKTALALVAALAVIADGGQVLLLAPTAVLAQQHHAFITRCLQDSRVRLGVLTGGAARGDRQRLLENLAGHRLDLLIGTHALLEEGVRCARLGLAIVDEQHKFGVEQRAALLARGATDQGIQPDLLLMTATPIPRTLALTAFGDLAVSRITGKPPGRAAVSTTVLPGTSEGALDAPLRECLADGGRAFVICPLRDESEKVAAFDATRVHRHLVKVFGADQVALLTGALAEDDKLAVLSRFARGEATILVATTVVEVGIDVPQATVMAVLDADRFGLAALHQLRGRIGRGDRAGRCLLFHRGAEGGTRLAILAASDDGLAIAEADLAERGPGHLLGTDQHGALRLRIADLARDLDLLQDAHQRATTRMASGLPTPPHLARFLRVDVDAGLLAGG